MRFPECFSKRLFLSLVISAVCLGLAASFVVRRGTATAGGPNFVYANNDLSGTNSVTAFEVGADGTLTNIGTFATGGSGGGSALGANRATVTVVGSFLYASNTASGDITAFSINSNSGSLTFLSTFSTGQKNNGPIGLAATPNGRFLIASNDLARSISVFGIGADGALVGPEANIAVPGQPDSIRLSPSGNVLAVTFNASRTIAMYTVDNNGNLSPAPGSPFSVSSPTTGRRTKSIDAGGSAAASISAIGINRTGTLLFAAVTNTPGVQTIEAFNIGGEGNLTKIAGSPFQYNASASGIENLAISPDGKHLYISSQSGQVTPYDALPDGTLVPNFTGAASLPGASFAAGMAMDRSGTFLFASGAGDSVVVNRIGQDGGLTTLTAQSASSSVSNQTTSGRSLAAFPSGDVVNAGTTVSTTTLSSGTPNPSTFGNPITFVATVTGSGPTPTGTVQFTVDGHPNQFSATLDGTGKATATVTLNNVFTGGTHSVIANYLGDATYAPSDSTAVTQTVNTISSSTALTSSVNPTVFGQSTTFTATVTAAAGTPTGTVTFKNGSTTLGTGTLNGSGVATFTTSSLAVGTNSITAVFGGDTNTTTSTSAAVPQVVNKANATASTVTSTVNPSVFGQSTTFSTTVTASAPGAGTPTGTVQFMDGATPLGSPVTVNGSGVATLAVTSLTVGSHTISAVYSGDANFNGTTAPSVTQVVNQAPNSTTTVTSSVNPTVFGQSTTFTATVAAVAPATGTPTGTVDFKDNGTTIGTGTLNGSGVATFATSALSVGNHPITAVFNGDANFPTSTGTLTNGQTVNKAASSTAVTSSTSPSVFGQSTTFTATVTATSPGAGTPTGTVTFKDGTTTLGTGTLNGSGVATFATSALTPGNHTITAVFGGDGNFTTSTGTLTNGQTVNTAATSTALTSSVNPTVFGQSTTFTATVTATAPGAGTPTGTVTFKDGTTTLGTGTLNGSGVATFNTSALAVGTHSITAVYGGDTNFATSTSPAVSQVVNQAASITTVTSSANPSAVSQSVTFTATVTATAPGAGTPTGTVTFKDGTTTLGTGTLNGSGVATFATSALTAGNHTITAVFSGDTNFTTSTGTLTNGQTVNAATTTALTSSVNPTVFGQPTTFTATVTATGGGTPTGTVTFKDGTTTLGTGTLNGSGVATFNTSALAVGTHSITAVYGGDANFATSTSSAVSQVVNQAASSIAVTSSANPAAVNQSVTFTATATATAPGAGTPTGTVTFLDGTTTLGTGTLSGGVATFTTTNLSGGTHNITAKFGGDTNFTTSTSTALVQTITKINTTTTLTSSVNPSIFGQPVTFTATVTSGVVVTAPSVGGRSTSRRTSTRSVNSAVVSPAALTPTGTVTFMDGTTTIGTGTLNGSGVATLTINNLAVGSHTITAVYGGDSSFNGSTSNPVVQVVNTTNTTTALTSSANPSVFGQTVNFTATVSPVTPSALVPTGPVLFFDGATPIGTVNLNSSGVAVLSIATLSVGSHTIQATYPGDGNFNASVSPTVIQVVNKAATTTVITTSVPAIFTGGPTLVNVKGSATFTATIVPTPPSSTLAGQPTGTVQFKDNGVNLGGPVTLVNGKASVTENNLTLGTHTITAVYSGDGNFLASTGTFAQQVGFIFKDNSNGNTLFVTVPANGVSGNGTYTWISGTTVIVSNVPALIEFNSSTVRIRTNTPSLNALFDATTQIGQAILFDTTRNQSFVINSSNFVISSVIPSGAPNGASTWIAESFVRSGGSNELSGNGGI